MIPKAMAAIAFLAVGLGSASPAPTSVGKPFDLQGYIDSALATGKKRIAVPPGTYRVAPRNRAHLRLTDRHNITLEMTGVEMICTETTTALALEGCSDVTVRGLSIDYDPLPFTQGRITSMSPDKSEHTIELFAGYPTAESVRNFKYEIFRPDTRTLRCDSEMRLTYYPTSVEEIDARHLRIRKGRGVASDPEQVGDIIVIASEHAPGGVAAHAVTLERCARVVLANIDVWASNCFGFLEHECNGTSYLRCRINRRPPGKDLVKRADPRIRSLNADAFHSIGATKGPSIVGCTARFMGDDAVNIHGAYSMVTACSGARLRVLLNGRPPVVGDPLELWTYEGFRLQDARVTAVAPDGKITDAERAFVMRQYMDEGIRRHGLTDAVAMTVDRAVDLPTGSLVCPTNRMGNGFLVKGCDFGWNRSRGILIKASDGQVVGNRLTGSWMAAVLVSPEYWWLESGSSSNVRIADNVIADCGATPIVVEAQGGTGKVAPSGAHRNIAIVGNRISGCPLPAIRVTSTDGLSIAGNRIRVVTQGVSDAVKVEQCTHTSVRANRIQPGASSGDGAR